LNGKVLKKSKDGSHFDLSQMVIKNTEPYYDGLFSDNDLVSRAYVDTVVTPLCNRPVGIFILAGFSGKNHWVGQIPTGSA